MTACTVPQGSNPLLAALSQPVKLGYIRQLPLSIESPLLAYLTPANTGTLALSSSLIPMIYSDSRAPEWIPWFREAELKHGRAAMLATAGFVVPQFMRIPGEQFSFDSIPNVIDAHDKLPESMIQIFAWISLIEACSFPALANMNEFDRRPGDFSFDPLSLYPEDAAKQNEMQLMELKNGRLAMIAIGGMLSGAYITGNGFPYLP
eukprot:scaffold34610_cov50-Attheya_sp.AAC.2